MSLGGVARVAATLVVVGIALACGWWAWTTYTLSPWTRDARVLANVVQVAPDVSGLISTIHVRDNQHVSRGDVLYEIDPERFESELDLAQAAVEMSTAALVFAQANVERYRRFSAGFSVEQGENMQAREAEAAATLRQAQARLALAELNMRRSHVRATVDGYVTNLTAVVGDYATTGQSMMAVVEEDSFYVYGYFEETKLPMVRPGAAAQIRLMAGGRVLEGRVQGLARAIANPDDAGGVLASVNPDYSWIQLAQRIPVRIDFVDLPEDLNLAAGMSASVTVLDPDP